MIKSRIRSLVAATFAAVIALGAAVPAQAAPSGPGAAPGFGQGPGYGPGPLPAPLPGPTPGYGGGMSNGVWTMPAVNQPGIPINTNTGGATVYAMPGSLLAVGADGTSLSWGSFNQQTGRWQGTWVRSTGLVACLLPLQTPYELTNFGIQFQQTLMIWGTFDVQLDPQTMQFSGSWGGCGIPGLGAWTGSRG